MDIVSIRSIVEAVPDPEIPVLTLGDLGVIRDIRLGTFGFEIDVTPTYSGCPATRVINEMISDALKTAKVEKFNIQNVLTPNWSTDWMSDEGKKKLLDYGIAPPNTNSSGPKECPQCKSENTSQISQFGSTPCQSLWRCEDCLEPFNYFKCL